MNAWHESEQARQAIGDRAESEFARRVVCHCGGRFDYIGNLKFSVDFTCENCGQLVDVKSTDARFPNVVVSKIPFDKYPDDLLIVAYAGGEFLGALRGGLTGISGPFEPTHAPGAKFNATQFYKIPRYNFVSLEEFGMEVKA